MNDHLAVFSESEAVDGLHTGFTGNCIGEIHNEIFSFTNAYEVRVGGGKPLSYLIQYGIV
ncbi:hypothetical protein ER57_11005 [Smithella sp. SCADC]|nr:hypothetical protein ER57_11005 [Smithella sp. SCADC]